MTEPTPSLADRPWVPAPSAELIRSVAAEAAGADGAAITATIDQLITDNRRIHDQDCVNLNPATNTMNPRAEAALSQGLGSRTSLGYAGAKYEMGLEAIERIEVICAELAARVFGAPYVEVRVPSGAMANLYGFMACAKPGDAIIVPPGSIAGHVTHHRSGAAGVAVARFDGVHTRSHAFAIDVAGRGGGQATAERLRLANLLTSAIGLPSGPDDGLRVGTNELVRLGATVADMDPLAELVAAAFTADNPSTVADQASAFRSRFTEVQFANT